MNSDRFDILAQQLGSRGTRRSTLGALLGGALGIHGLGTAAAKRSSGRCKKPCGECEQCKKGACQRKNGKKVCAKGKCKPKAAGSPCTAFPDGACQNGTCVNLKADEANCGSPGNACGPTQVCQAGSCFPRSTCAAKTTTFCSIAEAPCGTPSCVCSLSAEGNVVCVATAGADCTNITACTTSADCAAGEACVDIYPCCKGNIVQACFARCPAPT